MAGLNGGAGEVTATESGWAVIRLVPGAQWNLALRRSAAAGGDVHITVRVGDNEERRSIRLPG
jgi:antitoxin (DNA-binding transcriptional repressor) of toxin-antitoxin stability system